MRRYTWRPGGTLDSYDTGDIHDHEEGEWVSYEEAHETYLDYMCLARQLDGHDATECLLNLRMLKNNLAECRATLKLIAELPASHANNIAVMALRNTAPFQ